MIPTERNLFSGNKDTQSKLHPEAKTAIITSERSNRYIVADYFSLVQVGYQDASGSTYGSPHHYIGRKVL